MRNDISQRIKSLRRAIKLTQSQFAELVDLSEDSIGKIERGVTIPTIDTLCKISDGLKIPVSEFFGEEEPIKKNRNKALSDLMKYLNSKTSDDIKLIHEIAVKVLERNAKG
ncbi:MAG: helix-turn-helix transcriptional regulator [Deltaproteobacteria bacterium]|nr:helix-turn-helix transcriptional regulator [Deltaproteobacteria bacterium]